MLPGWRDVVGLKSEERLALFLVLTLGQRADPRRGSQCLGAAGGVVKSSEQEIAGRLALERRWLAPAIARIGARDAVGELLRFLRMRVPCQVIVSDLEAEYKLASLGLREQFDAVYVGERIGALKPSPRLFQAVLRDLEIPSQRLLHIGDRPETDGAAARAASCRVLVLGQDFGSFRQLLRVFAEGPGGPCRRPARP